MSFMSSPSSAKLRPLLIHALLAFPVAAAVAASDPAALDAARALLKQRKLAEAQHAFEKLAAGDPKNGEVNFQLGELALRRDDVQKAVSYLEQAVAAEPRRARWHRRLGDAYGRSAQKASVLRQLGFAKKCLASYQKAVELDPDDVDCRSSLFDYYRQAPGFAGGSREKAVEQAAAMKRLDPERGRIAFATLYVSDKNYGKAFAEFDEALKINPDDYVALFHIGRLAATTGQFADRGLETLRRCLELTPPASAPGHAAVHWRIGAILEKKNDRDGARAAYEAALAIDPRLNAAAEALRKLK
jgi:tetratricopeptide (TPR) repeat protein